MRFVRYEYQGATRYGLLQDDEVVTPLAGPPWEGIEPAGRSVPLSQVRLLAPCEPTKIVAVGRNYRAHAAEMGNEVPARPIIFLKPPTSVIGPGEAIVYPSISRNVHHEGELAVVIGRRCRSVRPEDVPACILGHTCGNDVTARDLQRLDEQWTRAKSFDTFCPLGPWIETELDWAEAEIVCRVNGQVRQRGHTRDMVFDVPALVAFIAQVMTLEPGDVVLTGTPEGVGPLVPGDQVEVEVEGLGVLANPVAEST